MDPDLDPRDLERDETRDIDMPWIELGRGPGSARDEDDLRDRDEGGHDRDSRQRDHDDPREVFADGLELPRTPEREIVLDGDHVLESITGHLSRRMLEHYSHIRDRRQAPGARRPGRAAW